MATYREVPRAPERKVGNVKQVLIAAGLFGFILSPGLLSAQAKKKADKKAGAAPAAVAMPAMDPSNRPTYRLGPGDVVQIKVYKEDDASVPEAVVRSDGRLTLPFVKDVPAGGLTIEELEKSLVAKLKPFIRDPDVTVILRQSNSQRVYVMGAVRKEGPVKITDQMTVLQALAEAGGVTEYAKRKKIFILRKQARLPFDYEAVLSGQKPELNVVIEPGDTIVVPN